MDRRNSQYSQRDLIQIAPLPQILPSPTCFQCDVCCRFPEPESALRPYFTREEIARAIEAGLDPAAFPNPEGGQVRLVPSPAGEGYLCPAFDPDSRRCGIYDARPVDCQIYPLALMWSQDGRRVVLGWDEKCPFVHERPGAGRGARGPDLQAYADEIAVALERDDTLTVLEKNPRLIGVYQDDVIALRALDRLTERLAEVREAAGAQDRKGSGVRGQGLAEESHYAPVPSPVASRLTSLDFPLAPHPLPLTLQPLTLDDRARLVAALAASKEHYHPVRLVPSYIATQA